MKKNSISEDITNAFIEIAEQQNSKEYGVFLKAINDELVNNAETLTESKIKSIVMKQKVNIKDTVLLFTILNAVLAILNNKLTKKEKIAYAPIIALLALMSIKKPKKFASNVYSIINPNATVTVKLGKLSKEKAKQIIDDYFVSNEANISNAIKKSEDKLIQSNRRRANTITRSIRKDIKELTQQGQSSKKIKKFIKEKYRVDDNVISRNLDTELHTQAEIVKLEASKEIGFTHKTWVSQGDDRVRNTTFHKHVIGKRIPIDDEFRYAGMKAEAPSDIDLPANERIRCRCYLIYD